MTRVMICLGLVSLMMAGCGDDDVKEPGTDNPDEVITTVNLTFTPQGGGDAITAQLRDADGEGGDDPVTTNPADLTAGTTYDVTVELLNETVPMSDEDYRIGEEIKEEAEEHQLFFVGSAVTGGVLTHAYADKESDYGENTGDDLPVGLKNTVTAVMAGTGELTVVLKHQPPVNDMAVKTTSSGVTTGDTDIEAKFTVTVK